MFNWFDLLVIYIKIFAVCFVLLCLILRNHVTHFKSCAIYATRILHLCFHVFLFLNLDMSAMICLVCPYSVHRPKMFCFLLLISKSMLHYLFCNHHSPIIYLSISYSHLNTFSSVVSFVFWFVVIAIFCNKLAAKHVVVCNLILLATK